MTRAARLALIMCVAALMAVSVPAHGQGSPTATPTPAVGSTPSPTASPTAAHIMDLMMRAWVGAKSAHFTMTDHVSEVIGTSNHRWNVTQTGDIDWSANPPVFQMAGPTATVKKKGNGYETIHQHEIQIFDQNLLAIKLGRQKWTCGRFFGYGSLPGSPNWDATSPYGLGGHIAGVTTVSGVMAWDIRAYRFYPLPKGSKGSGTRVTLDFFAATSSYLPLEIRTAFKYSAKTGHGSWSSAMRLSNFGESVHVILPAACAHK